MAGPPESKNVTAPTLLEMSDYDSRELALLAPGMQRSRAQDPVNRGVASDIAYVFHFLSFSVLSRTRNAVILRIRGRGNGFSIGNWIDPLAVAYFERSFAKALTADDVG